MEIYHVFQHPSLLQFTLVNTNIIGLPADINIHLNKQLYSYVKKILSILVQTKGMWNSMPFLRDSAWGKFNLSLDICSLLQCDTGHRKAPLLHKSKCQHGIEVVWFNKYFLARANCRWAKKQQFWHGSASYHAFWCQPHATFTEYSVSSFVLTSLLTLSKISHYHLGL